jgi:hypothetical protein
MKPSITKGVLTQAQMSVASRRWSLKLAVEVLNSVYLRKWVAFLLGINKPNATRTVGHARFAARRVAMSAA